MSDKEFLLWLASRIHEVYGENKNVDFLHKLRAIANNTEDRKCTPNVIN